MAVKLDPGSLYTKNSALKFIEILWTFFILQRKFSMLLLGQLDVELFVAISTQKFNQKSFGFLFEFV